MLDSEAMADEIGSAQDALALAQAQYEDSMRSKQLAYEQAVSVSLHLAYAQRKRFRNRF